MCAFERIRRSAVMLKPAGSGTTSVHGDVYR
jgi:hypothetical protein